MRSINIKDFINITDSACTTPKIKYIDFKDPNFNWLPFALYFIRQFSKVGKVMLNSTLELNISES